MPGAGPFVAWYNLEHRHSAIGYVTPVQRHTGHDREIPGARHALYVSARDRHPRRWSGRTRNWDPIGPVTLNPERGSLARALTAPDPNKSIA